MTYCWQSILRASNYHFLEKNHTYHTIGKRGGKYHIICNTLSQCHHLAYVQSIHRSKQWRNFNGHLKIGRLKRIKDDNGEIDLKSIQYIRLSKWCLTNIIGIERPLGKTMQPSLFHDFHGQYRCCAHQRCGQSSSETYPHGTCKRFHLINNQDGTFCRSHECK